ncbi:MAG: transcriptional regulator, XRE family [uncultured bacterium]|nr:MAG: transcriptional regulator, XRE family [uncultured bacterium]
MQTYKRLKKSILKDPEVRGHYEALKEEYSVISQVIKARINKGLSQKALAQKLGTKQSAISRFESGNYNPTLVFLAKISKALGAKLRVSIE